MISEFITDSEEALAAAVNAVHVWIHGSKTFVTTLEEEVVAEVAKIEAEVVQAVQAVEEVFVPAEVAPEVPVVEETVAVPEVITPVESE